MIDVESNNPRNVVLQQALALAPDDRAYIADALEQSLTALDFATPELADAWMAEIEWRAAAYERGEMPAENWRSVIARLRHSANEVVAE